VTLNSTCFLVPQNFDETTVAMTVAYLLITLTSIGLLSEGNPRGSYFELIRCVGFLLFSSQQDYFLRGALTLYFIPSIFIWTVYIIHQGFVITKAEIKNQQLTDSVVDESSIQSSQDQKVGPKIFNWGSYNKGHDNPFLVENTSLLAKKSG